MIMTLFTDTSTHVNTYMHALNALHNKQIDSPIC